MILRLRSRRETQKGFTIIELSVALFITALIGVGAAMSTIQVSSQGVRNSDYTTASQHAQNAILWISQDAQMAQVITPNGASGFPLTLSWTTWDNVSNNVTYTITGGELRRSYQISGGGAPRENLIAQYIDWVQNATSNTTAEKEVNNGVVIAKVKVTAITGNSTRTVSVTKEREIIPRPTL